MRAPPLLLLPLLTSSCLLPDQWTGRRMGTADIDGTTVAYREFLPPSPDGTVHFTFTFRGAPRDVVTLAGMTARDDGWGADRFGADDQFTGTYVLDEVRRDSTWLMRTRAPRMFETGRALPSREEQTHPYANRGFMTGGLGGEYDNGSVCPPGFVQSGIRYKRDDVGKSIAQAGALCRALDRLHVDGSLEHRSSSVVEGSTWGDDNKTPSLNVECPPGEAVLADGVATMGTWMRYQVLVGVTLRCASMIDPLRRVTTTLTIGFPGENGGLPLRCDQTRDAATTPFSSGVRIISGQRIDAIGFLCERPDERTPLPVDTMVFSHPPDGETELALPFQNAGGVVVRSVNRVLDARVDALLLPVADASLLVRAVPPLEAVSVQALVEGCVKQVTGDRLLIAAGSCASPAFLVEYRGRVQWRVTAGEQVQKGQALGIPVEPLLALRLVASSLRPGVDENGILPTELSTITGPGSERTLARHAP